MNNPHRDVLLKLRALPSGSLAVIGLGNPDRADDGFGIILTAQLKDCFPDRVFSEQERSIEGIVFDLLDRDGIAIILFVDVCDFGGEPGEMALFDFKSVERIIPAISTHKVPISFLMGIIRQRKKIPFLLGVQPLSLEFMGEMSNPLKNNLRILGDFFHCCLIRARTGERKM
jgi:hydrogenase maturation protease